jgi:hypothetical protein
MKKIHIMFWVVFLAISMSSSVQAGACQVDGLKVVSVFQWDDGSMFVTFDKSLGCGCSVDTRAGFHKNDDEKFFISAALTALTSGNSVLVRADSVNDTCPIHGNTARLKALVIKNH